MEELICITLTKGIKGLVTKTPKKIHLHYQATNERIEQEISQNLLGSKCFVYTYHEDFYLSNNISVKNVSNHECVFGDGSKRDDHWVIHTSCPQRDLGFSLLTREVKSYHEPNSKKVVRFNVLRFEVVHNEYHTTTYDIVFMNSWHKQYYTVCCESFSAATNPEYKAQVYTAIKNVVGVGSCKSKYLQYQHDFTVRNQHQGGGLCKYQPSFNLVVDLVNCFSKRHAEKQLSKKQIECLVTLCQQISLSSKSHFDKLIEEMNNWHCNPLLFSEMEDYKWGEAQNLLDVFKCWSFFPLQTLTQPEFTFKFEIVTESSNLYRYLLSSKFGNVLASQHLVEIFELGVDEFTEIAQFCKVTEKRTLSQYRDKSNTFPFVLLWHNEPNSIKVDENEQDPRVWSYGGKSCCKQYGREAFEKLLFGLDWYSLYLFTKGIWFMNVEDVKLLEQVNQGYFYHLKRQTTRNIMERLEFSKLAICQGINEDVDLLLVSKKVSETDKKEWENVAKLLDKIVT